MSLFADIALPTAARQVYTYEVPKAMQQHIQPGMRVWVPFISQHTIGMVVHVHDTQPTFKTKRISRVLDDKPIMSIELLKLTEWIHKYYFCSWGEAIQAALPLGLNFIAETYIRVHIEQIDRKGLSSTEAALLSDLCTTDSHELHSIQQKFKEDADRILKKFHKKGWISYWQLPVVKVQAKTELLYHWSSPEKALEATQLLPRAKEPKWRSTLRHLTEMALPLRHRFLVEDIGLDATQLRRLVKDGWLHTTDVEVSNEIRGLEYAPEKLKTLNHPQELATKAITDRLFTKEFHAFLLYGITGSGKTEVYIHAIQKALELGRGCIVLVPEIALTPQTVRRFYQIFGDKIAVLHSRLNNRERLEAWKALDSGEKTIAIGARSAVFAPVRHLGLIIIDEEHDGSYKQEDPAPRYHARDVALTRAWLNKAVVVYGSATPSLVSLHQVEEGKLTRLELQRRHAEASLPEVRLLDLKLYRKAMRGPLAVPLYLAIQHALGEKEQVILLHNRRGYSSYAQCSNCGKIEECPNCSVSLTYHKYGESLRCHYCGYAHSARRSCSSCAHPSLEFKGQGTQQITEEIEVLFPDARILRLDQDTTRTKDAHATILNAFARHEADILIGTQIVAKGLDFPNVTVVGVVNSDTELAFPSYRSAERMYQLLSQVAGRSGRGQKKGIVYLQTQQPEHFAFRHAIKHDYSGFVAEEMAHRNMLFYPPYSKFLLVSFKGKNGQVVQRVAELFSKALSEAAQTDVTGPTPHTIMRSHGEFRWDCFLKLHPENKASAIEQLLLKAQALYEPHKPEGASTVRITINVDALEV